MYIKHFIICEMLSVLTLLQSDYFSKAKDSINSIGVYGDKDLSTL